MTEQKHSTLYPLTSPQREIWFHQILHEGIPLYNIGGYVKIPGAINPVLFEQAVNLLVQKHDTLRTMLTEAADEDGVPMQTYAEKLAVTVPMRDFSTKDNPHKSAMAWMQQRFIEPFELTGQPLFRYDLVKISEDYYYWLLQYHHLIIDGYGVGLLYRSMAEIYTHIANGQTPNLHNPSYVSFINNDRAYVKSETFEKQRRYWLSLFPTLPEPLFSPRYHFHNTEKLIGSGCEVLYLQRSFYNRLNALAKQHNATLFHLLLGALYVYFTRTTQHKDFAIGLPVLNRANAQFKKTAGLFTCVNPTLFNFGFDISFVELLQLINKTLKANYRHQRFPVSEINREVGLGQERSQLFDINLSYENFDDDACFAGIYGQFIPLLHHYGQTPLMIFVRDYLIQSAVKLDLVFNLAYFNAGDIKALQARFVTILEAVLKDSISPIHTLPVMTEQEVQQLQAWNQTETDYPKDQTIVDLFQAQVEKTPENIAVVFEEQAISYQVLNTKANQLAHYLMTLEVGAETLVGICVERSLEMVIGLLGILKAGSAYVLFEPNLPEERLVSIITDSHLSILFVDYLRKSCPHTCRQLIVSDVLWINEHDYSPNVSLSSDDQAYIIYTSGTTGIPKGAIITHRALMNYVHWLKTECHLGPKDSATWHAPVNFDGGYACLWGMLLLGGTLHVINDEKRKDSQQMVDYLIHHKISFLKIIPSFFSLLLQVEDASGRPQLAKANTLKLLHIGGEKIEANQVACFIEGGSNTRIFNHYGPAEATIGSIVYPIKPQQIDGFLKQPIIGHPIANTQIHILDKNNQPQPIGIPGELCIAGSCLASGYLNRPELSKEKFIEIELFGKHQRIYKTGDLARWLPNGNIEYLGRLDHQVKLRGFRIELSEIEVSLNQHQAVEEAVVVLIKDDGNPRLAAYVTLAMPIDDVASVLRTWLKTRLPDYMLPASVIVLDKLPLTPNGKIDRKALPAPEAFNSNKHYQAPRDTVELQLAQIWEKVLKVRPIGISDNFFELGGHSLLAVRLMAQIEQQFNKHLSLAALFQNATIEQLANQLRLQTDAWSSLVAIQSNGRRPPFFCVPGVGGNVLYFYELAHHLGPEQPFYALQAVGLSGKSAPFTSIEEMATHYIKELQTIQPQGPYRLGGHSFGGLVAFEMSLQLQKQGHEIAFLGIFDMKAPPFNTQGVKWNETQWLHKVALFIERELGQKLEFDYETLQSLDADAQLDYLNKQLKKADCLPPNAPLTQLRGLVNVFKANSQIHYMPKGVTKTPITLFKAEQARTDVFENEPTCGWHKFSDNSVSVQILPGDHFSMMKKPQVQILAAQLKEGLEQALVVN